MNLPEFLRERDLLFSVFQLDLEGVHAAYLKSVEGAKDKLSSELSKLEIAFFRMKDDSEAPPSVPAGRDRFA